MEPLDIGKMKKRAAEQASASFEKRPFLFVRDPQKGKPDAAYRVKIDGVFRQYTGKESQQLRDAIDVQVIEVVDDSEAPKGSATLDVTREVLKNKLSADGKGVTPPQKDKVFSIMCLGKPKGKKYYDYLVIEETSALRAPSLVTIVKQHGSINV